MFALLAVGSLLAAYVAGGGAVRPMLVAASVSMATIWVGLQVAPAIYATLSRRRLRVVMSFLENDRAPGFCTDLHGAVFAQNRAASERFGACHGETLNRTLEALFTNPDAVVHRLRVTAEAEGSSCEDVATRRGHMRVAVNRIPDGYLWRLEDLAELPARAVDGIGLPVLTMGASGTILSMNDVLRQAVGRRVTRIGEVLEELPLLNGGLNRLLVEDGVREVRVALSDTMNGRQEVFMIPVGEGAEGRVSLDSLPVALVRLDAKGIVVYSNGHARDLLPALDGGAETRIAAMVEGLGRSIGEWVSEAAAGRGLHRPEVVRVTGAETETYLQITLGRPLGDGEGGLLAVLNDATELKSIEAQFVQSQKMQAIGQLAGGVAHDFNNLLTAISGHCDLLLLRHHEGDADHADLTQITQNANRAAALVGQLLAFSRKQNLQMEEIDLRDALGDLAHLLNRLVGERVSLRLHHDPALIPIRGDRRQLEQVLMNLVVNARDAMPDGGDIRIETHCRYLDAPMSRDRVTVPPGQYVVVTVADEGCGIAQDNLKRIFEPFFTTKRPGEGTGLGLSMAYGIVKQSGGYIFADSELGKGTVFSLYFQTASGSRALEDEDAAAAMLDMLPGPMPGSGMLASAFPIFSSLDASAEAAADADVGRVPSIAVDEAVMPERGTARHVEQGSIAAETAVVAGSDASDGPVAETSDESWTVLLVEDEAPVRAFASRALRLRGYTVLEAESAEVALEMLSDGDLAIDLFVTDVMMPGLDGPTWVRRALKSRPHVRTVFISGYTQDAMSETSLPVPNSVFLAKPFSLADLTRTVERALARGKEVPPVEPSPLAEAEDVVTAD